MLIIDGYNLIHAIGLLPVAGRGASRTGGKENVMFPKKPISALSASNQEPTLSGARYEPGVLERAREQLLTLVIKDLPESWRSETTIVFDALEPPEFLPDSYQRNGVHIVFARDYQDADEMIIEMVQNAQRGATVVVISSDHRIQAAVRRRHFIYRDSDQWYFGDMQLPERSPSADSDKASNNTPEKPSPDAPLSKEETDYWLRFFGK